MSDNIFEYISASKAMENRVCRVAYTINNKQPVACTIIGDQPLFYMDFEGDFEEEGLFEDADFAILESELTELKREIESFETFSNNFISGPNVRMEEFLEDKEIMLDYENVSENTNIAELIEVLEQSRLADAYMKCAAEYDVQIEYSEQIENSCYDRKNAKILVNPAMSQASQILVATQELRRHYQHRQGALIHPLMFHPDQAVLVNRAQVADLVTSMVRVAWELQLAGVKSAWEHIENSSIADLGRAFAREAYLDFRTINNGEAAAAVFEAWFLSDRCRSQDKALIQQMLSDYQGYVFELEEATKNITPTLIAALGEMPFGKNYLAEHAVTIMSDPIFSDIRDRSNANFLWFIKFERSFRESEQELQTSNHPAASGVRSDASQPKTQDDANAFAQKELGFYEDLPQSSAEIVTLYDSHDLNKNGDKSGKNAKRLSPNARSTRNEKKGANVVYLQRWSSE